MEGRMLLVGDVGGTKTHLAVFSAEDGPWKPLAEATFPSTRYSNLETLVGEFLERVRLPVRRASFGVAGPVVKGRAALTNLPWVVDEAHLRRVLNLSSVCLLNDVEAIAYAVPLLRPEDLHTLKAGEPVAGGAIAVIAPGTGLGEAFLTWDGSRYRAHPSEGGHTDFAPTPPLDVDLWHYLRARFEHISYERVCSGPGMLHLYAYLKEKGYDEPAWLTRRLAEAEDPVPVIVGAALEGRCELCVATLDAFIAILGAEAGNLALKVLALGGVYLGGGIPPQILPRLEGETFKRAFVQKGRYAGLLSRIPVYVILTPRAALLGAARYGFDMAEAG
jgi:glucokinase